MSNRSEPSKDNVNFTKSLYALFFLFLIVMLTGCATMIKKTLPPPSKPPFQYQGIDYRVFIDSNQVGKRNASFDTRRYFVSITMPKATEGKNLVPQKRAKAVAFAFMKQRICNKIFLKLKPVFVEKFNPSSFYRGGYFQCAKQ